MDWRWGEARGCGGRRSSNKFPFTRNGLPGKGIRRIALCGPSSPVNLWCCRSSRRTILIYNQPSTLKPERPLMVSRNFCPQIKKALNNFAKCCLKSTLEKSPGPAELNKNNCHPKDATILTMLFCLASLPGFQQAWKEVLSEGPLISYFWRYGFYLKGKWLSCPTENKSLTIFIFTHGSLASSGGLSGVPKLSQEEKSLCFHVGTFEVIYTNNLLYGFKTWISSPEAGEKAHIR